MHLTRFKTRITSFLMALALLGAGLVVAFHHHEAEAKAKGPEHCATCHLGQQAKIGTLDAGVVEIPTLDFFRETLLPAVTPKLIAAAFLLGKLSQAPPVAAQS
jgi:hypothetical protein